MKETFAELAELTGVRSHGIIRIPQYVKAIGEGRIRLDAQAVIQRQFAATASIDGGGGFGQVMASIAVEKAMELAASPEHLRRPLRRPLVTLTWKDWKGDEPELRFVHLRRMGSSQRGIYTGRMRNGYGQYFMGTGFLYMLAIAAFRLNEKPYVLGSLALLWGWVSSALQGKPRFEHAEFREFLRRYQRRALLVGKRRAIEEIAREGELARAR